MEIGAVTANFFSVLEKSVEEAFKTNKLFDSKIDEEFGFDTLSMNFLSTRPDENGNYISYEIKNGQIVSSKITEVKTAIEEEIAPGKVVRAFYDADGNLIQFNLNEFVPLAAEEIGIEQLSFEEYQKISEQYRTRFKEDETGITSSLNKFNKANIFANNDINIESQNITDKKSIEADKSKNNSISSSNFILGVSKKYGNTRSEAIENLVKELRQKGVRNIEVRSGEVYIDNNQDYLQFYSVNEDGEIEKTGMIARFAYNDKYDIIDPTKTPSENYLAKLPPSFISQYRAEEISDNQIKIYNKNGYSILTINDKGNNVHTEIYDESDGYALSVGKYGKDMQEALANVADMLKKNSDGAVIVQDNRVYVDSDSSFVKYYQVEPNGTVKTIGFEPRKVIDDENNK